MGATTLPLGALPFWGDALPGDELLVRFACSSCWPLGPGGLDWGLALLLVRSRGWVPADAGSMACEPTSW